MKAAALVCVISLATAATVGNADPLISYTTVLQRPHGRPDARIAYGGLAEQFGQLWLPADAHKAPVVVLVHGGCWLKSLPGLELMEPMADDLRRHGLAVWNIEYRRIGEVGGGYPGTFLDTAAAMDALKSLARTYPLDLTRVVVVGHSAGGQLALWAAARGRLPSDSQLRTASPLVVRAVVSLAGIDDLRRYRDEGPNACGGPATIDALVGADKRLGKAVYADTSPATLLAARTRQVIVSGGLDPIVPAKFGHDYAALAQAAGAPTVEMTLPRAGHFELIDPAGPDWTTIRDQIADSANSPSATDRNAVRRRTR